MLSRQSEIRWTWWTDWTLAAARLRVKWLPRGHRFRTDFSRWSENQAVTRSVRDREWCPDAITNSLCVNRVRVSRLLNTSRESTSSAEPHSGGSCAPPLGARNAFSSTRIPRRPRLPRGRALTDHMLDSGFLSSPVVFPGPRRFRRSRRQLWLIVNARHRLGRGSSGCRARRRPRRGRARPRRPC